jgi:uncharacterized membrane protein
MEDFFMSVRTKCLSSFFAILSAIILPANLPAAAADSVKLYTPYTRVSLAPGGSIIYAVDLINNSSEIKNVDISLTGVPKGWTYTLNSGGYSISQLSVLPKGKANMTLNVQVPLKVNKGTYRFQVVAGDYDVMPLTVIVSEQGTFKTELTTNQSNMEGNASSTFSFQTLLRNRTADKQLYALMANAPRGWIVNFKFNYKQVTSVETEPNSDSDITVEIDPPDMVEAGSYKIPIRATTSATTANLELEVVITGSYSFLLNTPSGLLSSSIIAGDERRLELAVTNNGSAQLKNIKLSAGAPVNWNVIFDPKEIVTLDPGQTAQIFATIKADRKAIAGDYGITIEAKTPEVTSKAALRISVKTPMLLGWIGVLIIMAALGSVYYLFRKYGRR